MSPTITQTIALGLIWYVAFLFSTTLHEAAHSWAALRMGDPTAYHGGQVSLNPIPHIRRSPFGMVIMPILAFALFGWMLGWASAPYDPAWADRHPKRSGLMALAGPAANLLLVLVSGVAIRVCVGLNWLSPSVGMPLNGTDATPHSIALTVLSVFFLLNLILLIFNLLPLPPLDGSGAVTLILPDALAVRYRQALRHPALALAGILIAWKVFGAIFQPVMIFALNLVYAG